jgi:hypothetical protein
MLNQRGTRLLVAGLWLATVLAALFLFRYQVVGVGGGMAAYRLDRWTGEMVYFNQYTFRPANQPK